MVTWLIRRGQVSLKAAMFASSIWRVIQPLASKKNHSLENSPHASKEVYLDISGPITSLSNRLSQEHI